MKILLFIYILLLGSSFGVLEKSAYCSLFTLPSLQLGIFLELSLELLLSQDIEILGWCPAGSVLAHGEKAPL